MQINANQLAAFHAYVRRQFHRDLLGRLDSHLALPLAGVNTEDLLERMNVWHARASKYGITSERALGRYLGIHLTMLPDFDLHSTAQHFMTSDAMSGESKMSLIYSLLQRR